MINGLKYTAGSLPGKRRKTQSSTQKDAEKRQNAKNTKKRERAFQPSWKVDRDWLQYDEASKKMRCQTCIDFYNNDERRSMLRPESMKWLDGTDALKKDNITKHEGSNSHKYASERKPPKPSAIGQTSAAKELKNLRNAQFRNAHAIAKWNLSFKSYVRLCKLDHAKGLNVNSTYENDKSAGEYIAYIARDKMNTISNVVDAAKYVSVTLDGCTDSSGTEQESIYVHFALEGTVHQHFVCFTSPNTTSADDIYQSLKSCLDCYLPGVQSKLVGLTSDGASNMMGVRRELVATHCLAHRLELGVRDAFKKHQNYDKLITLLVGLFYFNAKSSKQKKELLQAYEALKMKPLVPTRAGGTRWVPHIHLAATVLTKGYKAITTKLANASHKNPKAEGLYKLATDFNVVSFLLLVKEILGQVQNLSLMLQRKDTNLGEVVLMKSP
ncbi:ZN862-like protein [Mya arenaria]|uniref:ZN862-like protein n=1 Tax=Mya arenaria TaxID=6604 RepID=A0ABY7DR28_MYAAR|nr:ZN862-like protein [Mya arenaria]